MSDQPIKRQHTVPTIAALRAIVVTADMNGAIAAAQGYWAENDGGGGPARVLSTGQAPGTYTDNGGSIIVPTGGNGSTAWLWQWSGPINVRWFGAHADSATPDQTFINNAIAYAVTTGGSVYIPAGIYATTDSIGLTSALARYIAFPSIFGDKASGAEPSGTATIDGTVIKYTGTGNAVAFIASGYMFSGGTIRDITIQKNALAADGSIGLLLDHCRNFHLANVSCLSFDTNFKTVFSFSWSAVGLICMSGNVGALLTDNANAITITGAQLHQNGVNLKITGGSGITINGVTLEGAASVACVITSDGTSPSPNNIAINGAYLEANTHGFMLGQSESGVVSSATVGPVFINYPTLNITVPAFELDNVGSVTARGFSWGQSTALYTATSNTSQIAFFDASSPYHNEAESRYAHPKRLNQRSTANLLANGMNLLPDISDYVRGTLTAAIDTTTFAGETVIKITIPDGTAGNYSIRKYVKVSPDLVGSVVAFSSTCKADSGITATWQGYNSGYGGITGGAIAMPTASLDSARCYFVVPAGDYFLMALSFTNATGSTKYAYVKTAVLSEAQYATVPLAPSESDMLAGMSGTAAGVSTGTTVLLPGWVSDMYRVILTPQGAFTAYATRQDNQFIVTTVGADGDVDYLIIPRAGILQ